MAAGRGGGLVGAGCGGGRGGKCVRAGAGGGYRFAMVILRAGAECESGLREMDSGEEGDALKAYGDLLISLEHL